MKSTRFICWRSLLQGLAEKVSNELYRLVLQPGAVVDPNTSEARELLLSGLVSKQQGTLNVHHRIYQSIFNPSLD